MGVETEPETGGSRAQPDCVYKLRFPKKIYSLLLLDITTF
jgi:hypothetical protein